MKKIISVFLAGTLVFSFSGCFSKKKITPEDVKNRVIDEAEEYLKENYPDDTFTYVSGRSPNWAYPYYELAFSSAEYDNQELTVFAEPDEELKSDEGLTVYHYCDNYFQYYMKEDAEEYFTVIAKEHLKCDISTKVYFGTSIGASKKVKSNLSFEEYLKSDFKNILPWFSCDCNLDEKKDETHDLLEDLVDKNIYNLIRFKYKTTSDDSEYSGFKQFTTYNGIIEEII